MHRLSGSMACHFEFDFRVMTQEQDTVSLSSDLHEVMSGELELQGI